MAQSQFVKYLIHFSVGMHMFKLNIISVYSFIESTIWDAQGLA